MRFKTAHVGSHPYERQEEVESRYEIAVAAMGFGQLSDDVYQPSLLATHIAEAIKSLRPSTIDFTTSVKQQPLLFGGWTLSWETRDREIFFSVDNEGQVEACVSDGYKDESWQVEDFEVVWLEVQSRLQDRSWAGVP